MYSPQMPKTINKITSLFYLLGLWHRGNEPTFREMSLKIFYSIYHPLLIVSILVGANTTDNQYESTFLVEAAIMASVTWLKLLYIIWKQKQILEILNQNCVYCIDDSESFTIVSDKLKRFTKFVYFLLVVQNLGSGFGAIVVPFLGSEKKLFLDIGFPLDWKNDEISYWIAFAFVFTEILLTTIGFLFSPVFWYFMLNCGIKYDVLGNQIKKMGEVEIIDVTGRQRIVPKRDKFLGDLIKTVKIHYRIREETEQMTTFFSPLFLAQLATSGLCICGSIYSLIFSFSENAIEYLVYLLGLMYNIFEIFMVMHFGNEINVSSDLLTYSLFQSNWMDQPQSTKKLLIIFGETLKQPYVLLVAKLYPLTLQTFTRILNSAYSMFNILKKLK